MQLPPYFQHVRDALIRSGHTPADAYRITWGAIRRWAAGGGKAHPEVVAAARAALADLKAKAAVAHSHANEAGGGMTLTWNGHGIDLASVDLGGYLPPHVPAGSAAGGQFGSTSGGPAAAPAASAKAKAAAQARKNALHAQASKLRAQAAALNAQITAINATIAAQVKATAAAKAKAAAPSVTAKAAAAVKKAATTSAAATKAKTAAAKAPAAKKATLAQNRATVAGLHSKVHALLSQASALDKQANAIKLSSDDSGGRFLDLAFTEALAGRVPPGRRQGGQFTPAVVQLTRHDTPAMAARAVNAMGPEQRAMVRATVMAPPGFEWQSNDRLAEAGSVAPAR
jgi:hypothetical protein